MAVRYKARATVEAVTLHYNNPPYTYILGIGNTDESIPFVCYTEDTDSLSCSNSTRAMMA